MRVPVIATLDANNTETRPFLTLDGVGRIPFSKKDGEPLSFQADTVECSDFLIVRKDRDCFLTRWGSFGILVYM